MGGESKVVVLPASSIYDSNALPSSQTPFSMRRKSILSGVVHRLITGVGFIFSSGSVDRLTSVKGLDVMLALKYIGDHQRERERAEGVEASAEGIANAPLGILLGGFEKFADKVYKPIIPIPLTDKYAKWLYHDSGMCTITNKCWFCECPHFLAGEAAAGGQ